MSLTGQITTNGVVVDPVSFRGNIAYVMQDDALPFGKRPGKVGMVGMAPGDVKSRRMSSRGWSDVKSQGR